MFWQKSYWIYKQSCTSEYKDTKKILTTHICGLFRILVCLIIQGKDFSEFFHVLQVWQFNIREWKGKLLMNRAGIQMSATSPLLIPWEGEQAGMGKNRPMHTFCLCPSFCCLLSLCSAAFSSYCKFSFVSPLRGGLNPPIWNCRLDMGLVAVGVGIQKSRSSRKEWLLLGRVSYQWLVKSKWSVHSQSQKAFFSSSYRKFSTSHAQNGPKCDIDMWMNNFT